MLQLKLNINGKLHEKENKKRIEKQILEVEGFDGIRKNNARTIFSILLGFIILDFIYDCWTKLQ